MQMRKFLPTKIVALAAAIALTTVFVSCDDEDGGVLGTLDDITAKSEKARVIAEAKESYAADARLAGIYGYNVSRDGTVGLSDPTSNIFVYIVSSESVGDLEFYVPTLLGVQESPINLNTFLSTVEDPQAAGALGDVVAALSEAEIVESAAWDDSPDALQKCFAAEVYNSAEFGDAEVDMLLVPSVAIDTTGVSGNADWIVNLKQPDDSQVLWLHSATSRVTLLSQD
jgi:hypothetical protein